MRYYENGMMDEYNHSRLHSTIVVIHCNIIKYCFVLFFRYWFMGR